MYKAKNKYHIEHVTLMLAEGAESSSNVHFKAKLRPAGGGPGPSAAGVSIVQAQADLIGALCSAWLCSAVHGGHNQTRPGQRGAAGRPGDGGTKAADSIAWHRREASGLGSRTRLAQEQTRADVTANSAACPNALPLPGASVGFVPFLRASFRLPRWGGHRKHPK